jgi:hypothetical protein
LKDGSGADQLRERDQDRDQDRIHQTDDGGDGAGEQTQKRWWWPF